MKRKEKAVSVFQHWSIKNKEFKCSLSGVLCSRFFQQLVWVFILQNNPEEAGNDLKLEDFIYKRHNSTDWTELIEAFYNAKKRFLKAVGNKDELKSYL